MSVTRNTVAWLMEAEGGQITAYPQMINTDSPQP